MEQTKKGCLFLLMISLLLLLLSVLRSGVHAAPDLAVADGSKQIGANETHAPEVGLSGVTIINGEHCNGHGGHGAPGTPAVSNPWIISSAADHHRGHCAAGTCVLLLGAAVSWLLHL